LLFICEFVLLLRSLIFLAINPRLKHLMMQTNKNHNPHLAAKDEQSTAGPKIWRNA
jgi:hypothetical protein